LATITALREQIETERQRADRAEQGREGERVRADSLRDRLNAMQGQLADAHAALQRAETADARADRAERDKERAEAGRDAERARADALRDQVTSLQAQLATAEAEAKAVNDRAWATGEQLGAAEQRAETERERADRLASSVAHERQDFLDAESRTRRELDEVRGQVEALRVQLGARQEVVDAAEAIRQADDRRRALGRWARLRRAWRGG
jgi:chromosome segregation ATPase